MSTRAVFTFIDGSGIWHVYKHNDGYPSGAALAIHAAAEKAWTFPRFEADEFSTAFIAANKTREGDVRLSMGWKRHGDLDYRYEIRADAQHGAWIIAFKVDDKGKPKEIWRGPFSQLSQLKEIA